MSFDAKLGRLVLSGGTSSPYGPSCEMCDEGVTVLTDRWWWDGRTWRQEASAQPSLPAPQVVAANAAGGSILGVDLRPAPSCPDESVPYCPAPSDPSEQTYDVLTWRFSGSRWARVGPEQALPGSHGPVGPVELLVDTNEHRDLLIDHALNMWSWDGRTWSRQPAAGIVPPERAFGAMAYDAVHGQVVVFGGAQPPTGANLLDDTWTWNGRSWTPHRAAGQDSEPPDVPEAPSPSPTPQPPLPACGPGQLLFEDLPGLASSIEMDEPGAWIVVGPSSWQSRGSSPGLASTPCRAHFAVTVTIEDGAGRPLAILHNGARVLADVNLVNEPPGRLDVNPSFVWRNWCGPKRRYTLSGDAAGIRWGNSVSSPTCEDPSRPSVLQGVLAKGISGQVVPGDAGG